MGHTQVVFHSALTLRLPYQSCTCHTALPHSVHLHSQNSVTLKFCGLRFGAEAGGCAGAGVLIAGDDFKSGQTKIKSVLVDFMVGAGIKPTSIVSYNHLGNNDGMNLSAPQTFRSKEISKSNVVCTYRDLLSVADDGARQ